MKKIAIFGGSFNPPGQHHRAIAAQLAKDFDEVVVIPCGPRPDKPSNDVKPVYRATMVDMNFRGISKLRVELFDLEADTFTRSHQLQDRFKSEGELWHIVGSDLIVGGGKGKSFIHTIWEQGAKLWKDLNFIVIKRPGFDFVPSDLPPKSRIIEVNETGSSSLIRDNLFHRESIETLLLPEVARYVERHGLYRGMRPSRTTRFHLEEIRPLIIIDERNPEAQRIGASLPLQQSSDPNLILCIGGDGAMLRTIRRFWRMRIPFYGINAGHLGFLLNDSTEALLSKKELTLHQLPFLRVETETASKEKRIDLAFNDAWVERAAGQTAWIQMKVNGKDRLPQLMADAALVATAAGSASYARAMGAPPLPFNTPALLVVGSNVLKPFGWKSAVVPLDTTLEFKALDPVKRPLNGYIDGVSIGNILNTRVRLSQTAAVELVFDPEHDPAEKLASIQFPTVN